METENRPRNEGKKKNKKNGWTETQENKCIIRNAYEIYAEESICAFVFDAYVRRRRKTQDGQGNK